MSIGSGLFKKMHGKLQHLLNAGGLAGEIADVRKDIAATVSPMLAVTVEEYIRPSGAVAAAVLAVTASSLSAQTYTQQSGVSSAKLFPPRNITVTTAGATATHAPATVTINGLDAQGLPLAETITGVNGGAGTYSGVKCFSQVISVVTPAAAGTDATFSVNTGIVMGLGQTPKLRAGQALPLIRREVYDGSIVTNGVLTLPATNPPYGAYTPNTAPVTPTAAAFTGSTDITAAGLYGAGGTLAGGGTPLALVLTVNGVGPTTLTFDGTGGTSSASEAAMLAAINAAFPGLTATQNGSNHLVLTDNTSGALASMVLAAVGTSTANTVLGLTAGTQTGTGHQYCIDYEFDGSLVSDAQVNSSWND